jgi:NADPH-dependent 2,4-dienoyl-CoA reductase/sulfur reductase-like enzyme
MSAASVAKRRDRDLVVTVFEQGSSISYSACSMPYRLGGMIDHPMRELVVLTPEDARKRGLDVRTRTRVTGVDAKKKQVHWVEVDSHEEGVESYDELVIATGAVPREAVPVAPSGGVFSLRSLDDGVELEAWLSRQGVERAVVVGAGFIGVELCEAFLARGLEVTLVNRSRHVLRSMLDEPLGHLVADRLEASGVRLVTGSTVSGWVSDDGTVHQVKEAETQKSPEGPALKAGTKQRRVRDGLQAAGELDRPVSRKGLSSQDPKAHPDASPVKQVLIDGKPTATDVVVVATGVQPDPRLAVQAGCRLHQDGSVWVDDSMRTSVKGVWACGDVVSFTHRVTGAPMFLPLALHANRSGRVVGTNLSGGDARFPGVLATAITRFQELEVASTGLTQTMAERHGIEVVVSDVDSETRAGYMPGEHPVRVRMVAELASGRLLGVQMVGAAGTALRIDAAAAMVWMEATLEQVEAMDLAYNPPFSPVWDPLAIAARITEKRRAP